MTIDTRATWYVLGCALSFAAVSICFGAAWGTALVQLPVIEHLTPANYSLHFIPQRQAAGGPFALLLGLVAATAVMMAVGEWRTRLWWVPLLLLLLAGAAACLARLVIAPVSDALAQGIPDQAHLDEALSRWRLLVWVCVAGWSAGWALLAYYFAARARTAGGTTDATAQKQTDAEGSAESPD